MDASLDVIYRAAVTGDESAFRQLVERTHRSLRVFIAARTASYDAVEEALQATYITVYERRDAPVAPGSVMAWLRGIARNKVREILRSAAREVSLDDGLEAVVAAGMLERCEDAEDRADEHDGVLERCLDRLRPRARQILEGAYREGLSHKHLARRFSMPTAAITRLLFSLRQNLRRCLVAQGVHG